MDDRTYTFEDIAAYLAGELPSGEQEAFDQQVAKDQELAARVDQQRLTHQAVDLYTQLRTKEEIRAIYQGGAKVRRLPNRSLLAVAASVAILLLAGFWWQRSQYRSPALAGQYFTAYPDRLTTMSGDTEADLAAAMDAYNASDYERALALFQALPAELPQAGLIRLYTGITQLRTGDAAAAHTSL
ncbi:MAG: hypothetical protein KDC54_06310, partial [Lewinella sp.]|nr:hypothetical protein [Lewinella sp.]